MKKSDLFRKFQVALGISSNDDSFAHFENFLRQASERFKDAEVDDAAAERLLAEIRKPEVRLQFIVKMAQAKQRSKS